MVYDREVLYSILDEALVCHCSTVVDGEPRVLPTLQVRVDDTLYLHASAGSRMALAARDDDGVPVCVAVSLLDALVLARSQFHHSVDYRSVIAHGRARLVTDDAQRRHVLSALVDKIATGRAASTRPPTGRELARTAVLAIPLREAAAKVRRSGVVDDAADLALPHWAGVIPLGTVAGRPEPAPGVATVVPEYLRPRRSAWLTPAPMRGRLVALEPLDLAHTAGLRRALADPEVWRHLPWHTPTSDEEMASIIRSRLDDAHQGRWVPWVQREVSTGRIVGTTSYCPAEPEQRRVHIGASWLGRPWWGTGINAESKLLLMARAFEELGAVRVEWWADVENTRSQRALQRIGAVREGVLRRYRQGPDGTWHDVVLYSMTDEEWPAARDRLVLRVGQESPGRTR